MNMTSIETDTDNTAMEYLQALLQQEHRYHSNTDGTTSCNYPTPSLAYRKQISQWIVKVAQAFQLGQNEDLAATILSCLDRFVIETQIQTPEQYQLAALTCLYTCIKVHCNKSLSIQLVTQQLSQNAFSVQQVLQMERQLLETLQWKLHPPSAMDFVRLYLQQRQRQQQQEQQEEEFEAMLMMSEDENEQEKYNASHCHNKNKTLLELCKFQLQDALHDYASFGHYRPSVLALAALANAMECQQLPYNNNNNKGGLSSSQRSWLESLATTIRLTSPRKFYRTRHQLYAALEKNADHPALRNILHSCKSMERPSREAILAVVSNCPSSSSSSSTSFSSSSTNSSNSDDNGIRVLQESSRLGNNETTVTTTRSTTKAIEEEENVDDEQQNGIAAMSPATPMVAAKQSPRTVNDDAILMMYSYY
jgi:Cyclin, N-terminal domain/Cyclin, C-terminal domain